MKNSMIVLGIIAGLGIGCSQQVPSQQFRSNFRELTQEEARVILHKGTEMPYSGEYEEFWEEGIYSCKQCGAELYRSGDKFNAYCGWPSFDDAIDGTVSRIPDADGHRTEIVCSNCGGHLGHVFLGEGFTDKNTRHCVNSISLEFIPAGMQFKSLSDTAFFAGGCFWGVEYFMEQAQGVIQAESGYMGGSRKNPSYREVSSHATGHAEVVSVVYNPLVTDFETLARLFFEIHDPTQKNRQGPDIGEQYRSEIFYRNEKQKAMAIKLIGLLERNGYKVTTRVSPAGKFWLAEDYHQDYYTHKKGTPYCHTYVKRF
jgi:peptide methionine sulfoxide reductase msrA/msrB